MLYWITVPALTCLALMPFGRTMFDLLYPALACPALGLAVIWPVSAGFRSRRYRGVIAFFWGSLAAVALIALSLLVIAVALATTWYAPPPLVGMTWAGGAVLVLLATLLPFPLRALRLRYWHPGASAAVWEPGDERVPAR